MFWTPFATNHHGTAFLLAVVLGILFATVLSVVVNCRSLCDLDLS